MIPRILCITLLSLFISCNGSNATLEAENAKLKEENVRLRAQLEGRPAQSQAVTQSPQINIQNPVLEVQRLKVYSYTSSSTHIDFRLTNKSDQFLDFWSVGADILNSKNEYLGHYNTNHNNLRPGQSITATLIFSNVIVSDVASWKPAIDKVSIDIGSGKRQDATRYYSLEEVKP